MCELLVQEAHGGGLMKHFGIKRTLATLQEHFFWPRMRRAFNVSKLSLGCYHMDFIHLCTDLMNLGSTYINGFYLGVT